MLRRPLLTSLAAALCTAACDAPARPALAGVMSASAAEARNAVDDADGGWTAASPADALTAVLGRRARHELASAAVDAAGVVHAVFALDGDGDGHPDALEHATLRDGRWSAPQPVVASMSLAQAARVAVDGDGAVHVLWYGHSGAAAARDVPTELVERTLAGGRWRAPRVLYREASRFGMNVRWLAAAADAGGDVQVLFAPQGRGFGHLSLRGAAVRPARYLDHDGNMMTFSVSAAGGPLEVAYIGEAVSARRRTAVNDVFVRSLRAGRWGPRTEAYYGPARYSHYPQLVVDGGVRHLFWLEDTDGSVPPEALYHATSTDGVAWSPPRDLTPPALRGGVLFRVAAAPGADGRIHLLLRRARPDGSRPGLYWLELRDGVPGSVRPLAGPGDLGQGEAQLLRDPLRHRMVALWRGGDGVYRWATRPE